MAHVKAILVSFRDPEETASIRRLGDLLYEVVNESGQFGPGEEENRVRPALLAIARDLLGAASNPTEIADECRWRRERPEVEPQFVG